MLLFLEVPGLSISPGLAIQIVLELSSTAPAKCLHSDLKSHLKSTVKISHVSMTTYLTHAVEECDCTVARSLHYS
jgi:hypothetical protein